MNNKLIIIVSIALLIVAGCQFGQTDVESSNQGIGKQLNQHDGDYLDDYPYEDISEAEVEALNFAINDEYKARATYRKVIEKFGEVRPFINIVSSEGNHIDELEALYEKYGLGIPEDDWYAKVPEFDTIAEACQAGVDAEIENAALYDSMFEYIDNQDITAVFTSLRNASETNHLPAFQRCGGK